MYAANSYVLRLATEADAEALRRLAELDSQAPLQGSILIGELHGEPVAALSLTDDRAIADPFRPTAHLVELLELRSTHLRSDSNASPPALRRPQAWLRSLIAASRP
jgi:hypothetical protein